jgi:hypothetical protein
MALLAEYATKQTTEIKIPFEICYRRCEEASLEHAM